MAVQTSPNKWGFLASQLNGHCLVHLLRTFPLLWLIGPLMSLSTVQALKSPFVSQSLSSSPATWRLVLLVQSLVFS